MDGQAPDQGQSNAAAPVWNLLDRHDPAWRALYSLYNSDSIQGKAAGLQYSLQNRQAMQQKVAARAAAAAATAAAAAKAAEQQKPSPKKKVAVPHFKQRVQQVCDPLAAVPHRRPAGVIKAALEAEVQQAWGRVPLPSGRLIDEQEKQRCALLMQFRGNMPIPSQLTAAGRAKAAAAAARSSSSSSSSSSSCGMHSADAVVDQMARHRAALQQRFEEVEQEVAERQEYVESMQQMGRLQQDQLTAMRAEAAGKVREMRQLDAQIRELDAQLRVAYTQDS